MMLNFGFTLPVICCSLSIFIDQCLAVAIDNGVVEGVEGSGPFRLPVQDSQVHCNVRQRPADILFLVDGSSSVGQENFNRMLDFIMNIIHGFIISPQVVQIGLTQFSGDPRTEFSLNQHSTMDGVIHAVRGVSYLEGSTNTGKALMYVIQNELVPSKGMRPGVPQMTVIITDGASQDEVTNAAGEAARRGVDVFAVAITPDISDRQLLELVGGLQDRVFKVTNFKELQTDLINRLVEDICMAVEFRDDAPPVAGSSGGPSVQCKTEGIVFNARSKRPFGGKVYIKGYYDNPSCRKPADTNRPSTDISFTVPMDGCGMRRVRSLNPAGVSAEVTVIVSFHPIILTKVDRAYRIKCFFMEAVKMVSTGVDVSMLATQDLQDQAPMPACSYTIRSQSQDGPVVRYANVGDKIYHVWQCSLDDGNGGSSSSGMHALLVHSCTADDGSGNVVNVLDSRGCAVDPVVLQNLIYDGSLTRAYQETHAYKFADRTALYFQCQISLCLKMEQSCRDIVPPQCEDQIRRREDQKTRPQVDPSGSYGNFPITDLGIHGPPGPPGSRVGSQTGPPSNNIGFVSDYPLDDYSQTGPLSNNIGFVPDYPLDDYSQTVIGNVDAYTQVDVLEGAGPDPFDPGYPQTIPDLNFAHSQRGQSFANDHQKPYVARIRYSPLGLNFTGTGQSGSDSGSGTGSGSGGGPDRRILYLEGKVCVNLEIIAVVSLILCLSLSVLTVNCCRQCRKAKLYPGKHVTYPRFGGYNASI